jgi:hypothetical protein
VGLRVKFASQNASYCELQQYLVAWNHPKCLTVCVCMCLIHKRMSNTMKIVGLSGLDGMVGSELSIVRENFFDLDDRV